MKIVIDISVFQDCWTFDKFKLLVDNGVKGVIIRAGYYHSEDRMVSTYVNWCDQLNIPYSFYFYYYPPLIDQADMFINIAHKYMAKFYWSDVEEAVGSAEYLDSFYKTVFDKTEKAFGTRVGNYSRKLLIDGKIPNMYKWAGQKPYWNAHYCKYYKWYQDYLAFIGATWDSSAKTISITNLRSIMKMIWSHNGDPDPNFIDMNEPPEGFNKPVLWQATTFLPFTELTEWQMHLDYDLCSDNDFDVLFLQKNLTIWWKLNPIRIIKKLFNI